MTKEIDVGPWVVRRDENRQWRICSENFKHDVELIITGDFGEETEIVDYAADLARRLSTPPTDALKVIFHNMDSNGDPIGAQPETSWEKGYAAGLRYAYRVLKERGVDLPACTAALDSVGSKK